jgi:hypothetical protein
MVAGRLAGEVVIDIDGCFDLDPTGRVVLADGAIVCTTPAGDLVGPLLGMIMGDEEGFVSSLVGDGVMDGPSGAIVVVGLKTVGGGTGTISPFSQIDSGTECMRFMFNPVTASLSFNIGIRSPPTLPARTGTCDIAVGCTTLFFFNAVP